MKKYLIISLSTGGGHKTVADSISEVLIKKKYEVKNIDLFKYINAKGLDILICGGYNLIATKIPRFYGTVYRTGNKPTVVKCSFDLARRLCQKKIKELIDLYKPDSIVVVHPIATDILGGMKQKKLLKNEKIISIITDYLSHYVYIRKNKYIDAYLVAGEITKDDLIKKGVDPKKIYAYGIPIRNEFYKFSKKNKKNKNSILVMGGSLGAKEMNKVINSLFNIKKNLKIQVVCGRDEELKEKISKYINKDISKKITVFGFTNKIAKLMDESNLLITKPGGASITEALLRKIPIIIPYLIGGQEKENLEYLVNEGVATWVGNYKKIPLVVEELLSNNKKVEEIQKKMSLLSKNFSKEKVIKIIEKI